MIKVRKFKFRAWHVTAKEMIYDENFGDCLQWFRQGQPLEIMQFVGLTDRNGKEIYEGDICSDGQGTVAPIEWVQDHCQFLWVYEGDVQEVGEWCEVIGNIYENPELLEVS